MLQQVLNSCSVRIKRDHQCACYLLHAGVLFGLFVDPENVGDMFLRNSVDFQRTTGRYFPVDRNLLNDRCENLKSYTAVLSYAVTP
jgi:hypothetical protein